MAFNCSGSFAHRSFVSVFGNTRVVGFIKKLTFWARFVVCLEISFPLIFEKYKIMIMHFKSFECCLSSSSTALHPSQYTLDVRLQTKRPILDCSRCFSKIIYHCNNAYNYYVYLPTSLYCRHTLYKGFDAIWAGAQ